MASFTRSEVRAILYARVFNAEKSGRPLSLKRRVKSALDSLKVQVKEDKVRSIT